MSNILFHITMGTGLALAVDKNNPNPGGVLLLLNANDQDPDQQWSYVFDPATQASILYNPARNLFAAPTNIETGARVVLHKTDAGFTPATTWQVLGSTNAAIRPPANTDLNMNALGSSWPVGTQVGIWSWGGGAPNEVWTSKIIKPR
jgi:hypothetical protein